MIELRFTGEDYAAVLAACRDWMAQREAPGDGLAAPARSAQPLPDYSSANPEGNVLPFPAPVAPAVPAPAPGYPPAASAPAQTQTAPASVPSYPSAPAPIPTAAPRYTRKDLMDAGARLMTTVGLPVMQQLLARFGVPAIHQLPPERYGEFAQALRDMGGTI